jgi:hypothetical protein
MHRGNAVMHDVRLRDGAPVREFLRCNPHWAAVDEGETADGLAEVVVDPMLDTLVRRGGACVLYTHLGKVKDPARPFGPATCAALGRLAERQQRGDLLVTTTRRLLGQRRAAREAQVRTAPADGGLQRVDVTYAGPPADLDGFTVYVADPDRATLAVNGAPAPRVVRNPPDQTGRASIALPWPRLAYPA